MRGQALPLVTRSIRRRLSVAIAPTALASKLVVRSDLRFTAHSNPWDFPGATH